MKSAVTAVYLFCAALLFSQLQADDSIEKGKWTRNIKISAEYILLLIAIRGTPGKGEGGLRVTLFGHRLTVSRPSGASYPELTLL